MWTRRFAADPAIVGQTVELNAIPFTIVGVAPRGFKGVNAFNVPEVLWVTTGVHDQVLSGFGRQIFMLRRGLMCTVFARLRPDVPLAEAETSAKAVAARLAHDFPRDNGGRTVAVVPLRQTIVGINQRDQYATIARVLMTIVGFVLLIACVNLANLLLARGAARERELAVRAAIGAGPRRIIRQLLTEGVVLSVLGGAAGLLLGYWGRQLLWAYRPPFLPVDALDLSFDGRVLAFTGLVAVATGIAFSALPAVKTSRLPLVDSLKAGGRGGSPTGGRLRSVLVAAEIALALVALAGAGLFVRSAQHAQSLPLGFESERLFVMSVNTDTRNYAPERGQQFVDAALARATAIPGVEAAAFGAVSPLGGAQVRSVYTDDRPPDAPGIFVTTASVTPGYFDTLRIPLKRGRGFTEFDREGTARVAVVSESFSRRFWPNGEAIGRKVHFFNEPDWFEIVGIVDDVTVDTLGDRDRPFFYVPLRQYYVPGLTLHVRTSSDPSRLLPVVRTAVQEVDPQLAIVAPSTIAEIIDQALWAPRTGAAMLAAFGGLALCLAMIGIYGVMSYSVSQRKTEIGVRLALGASPGNVRGLVLRQAAILAAVGIVAGLGLALVLGHSAASLLYDVNPVDVLTLGTVATVLALTALGAAWLPSIRASRTSPLLALRS
jgi:predicted permease